MRQVVMWENVFNRYFEQVYAYVAYRVAPDWEAAQDITQEVFSGAFQSHQSSPPNGSVLFWLRGIARHKVADHFRGQTERVSQRVPSSPAPVSDRPDTSPAEAEIDRAARAMLVSLALRGLPTNYAELLEEKYMEGSPVRQIASRRGASEKAIESALTRARAAFRQAYRRQQNRQTGKDSKS